MARLRLPYRVTIIAFVGLPFIMGPWREPPRSILPTGVHVTSSTSSAPNRLIAGSDCTKITKHSCAETSPSDGDSEWTTNDTTVDTTWINLIAAVAFEIRVGDAGLSPPPPPPPPPKPRGTPTAEDRHEP